MYSNCTCNASCNTRDAIEHETARDDRPVGGTFWGKMFSERRKSRAGRQRPARPRPNRTANVHWRARTVGHGNPHPRTRPRPARWRIGASTHDARTISDYHSSQALERKQCHTNDPQWLALITAPRTPASTPTRTPTHAPTDCPDPPTGNSPPASSTYRRAPATLTTLSTIFSTAALACLSPMSTDSAPPDPAHPSARCATACSVAAMTLLLQATMTRGTEGPTRRQSRQRRQHRMRQVRPALPRHPPPICRRRRTPSRTTPAPYLLCQRRRTDPASQYY